jgi:ribosome-binding factor A
MAHGRRVERVAALVRREISDLLVHGIRDERVHAGMVSVTNVDVAGDLQHCRIFVSVLGSEEDRQQVLAGLRAAAPYVRGELGRRLKLRRTPEVVFQLDKGLERGTTVLGLLNRLELERRDRGEIPPGSDERSGPDEQQPHGAGSGSHGSATPDANPSAATIDAATSGHGVDTTAAYGTDPAAHADSHARSGPARQGATAAAPIRSDRLAPGEQPPHAAGHNHLGSAEDG